MPCQILMGFRAEGEGILGVFLPVGTQKNTKYAGADIPLELQGHALTHKGATASKSRPAARGPGPLPQ